MLTKNLKIWTLALLSILAITLTSCENEETSELIDTENFVDPAIQALQNGAIGKSACLELVFPITINFVDETSAEVDSYEALYETVSAWFESTGTEKDRANKPELSFPIQVINQDGETMDVASKDELQELKRECGGRFDKPGKGRRGPGGKGYHCFSLVFPVSAVIGEETLSFDDKDAFHEAVKAYKMENGRDADRPELVFPITVEAEDGTQTEVASKEDLQALKESCAD